MADAKDDENKNRARELLEQLQSLSTRAAADFFELVHRVNAARDEADGTPFSGGDNSGVSTRPRPSGGELLFDLVKVQLETANKLLDISHKHTDLVFDRAQRIATGFVPPEKRVTRLKAEQSANQEPKWTVYVHNAAHRARRLHLRPVRHWHDHDGKEVAKCEPSIPSPEVAARCERKIEITHPRIGGASGDEHTADVELVLDRQVVGILELTLKIS